MKFDILVKLYNLVSCMELLLMLTTVNAFTQNGCECHQCKPVDVNIFWDRNADDDVFSVQRHYVLRIINRLTEKSNVRIVDVRNSHKFEILMDVVIDKTDAWIETVTNIPRLNTEHHTISYKKFLDATNENINSEGERAYLLFYVVNENSTIDDESKFLDTMERFRSYVVYKGTGQPSKFWYQLTSDANQLLNLNDNLGLDVESFLRQICDCGDPKHDCDRNMYWTGTKCNACSYICSRTPSEDPPYCLDVCKHFRTQSTKDSGHAARVVSYTIVGGCVFMVILVVKSLFLRKLIN